MTGSSDDALDVIDRIYEAAIDDELWPDALVALTEAIGGAQVMMGVNDPAGERTVIAPRMDPEAVASYRDHWGRHDMLWRRTNRAPVGEILHAEDYAPRQELERTEFYNEWHRPLGIGAAGLGVNLFVENGLPAVCGIKRALGDDGFSADQVALFTRVAPHLRRAVDVQRRLRHLELARSASSAAGRKGGACVILVDSARRPLDADAGGRALLDARDGLCLETGRLAATDGAASARLAGLVERCTRTARARPRRGGSVDVSRGHRRPPLRVDVAPAGRERSRRGWDWLRRVAPAAVVTVTDPELASEVARDRLRERFGLTPAEADLAVEICRGDGREAAADRLGISVDTARTHLTRVFAKTGVRRQAELVRLFMEVARAPG